MVSLLKSNKPSQFEWTLKEDKIYRNQVCLSVGPYDSFQFSLSPTYIKIALSTTTKGNRKIPLGQVCCDVLNKINSSIHSVTEALHYTQKAAHKLAFACPEPPPHDQSHAATINFSPKGEPCTMTCQLTGKLYPDLPDGHMIWFDEVSCFADCYCIVLRISYFNRIRVFRQNPVFITYLLQLVRQQVAMCNSINCRHFDLVMAIYFLQILLHVLLCQNCTNLIV